MAALVGAALVEAKAYSASAPAVHWTSASEQREYGGSSTEGIEEAQAPANNGSRNECKRPSSEW